LPSLRNAVFAVVEPAVVMGLAVLTAYSALALICFPVLNERRIRVKDAIETLGRNWVVVTVILVPLFYRTVRSFLDELREGPFGMKREPRRIEVLQAHNPPSRKEG
jgi:ABC-type spermidine/putrescine transport system permease subunit II